MSGKKSETSYPNIGMVNRAAGKGFYVHYYKIFFFNPREQIDRGRLKKLLKVTRSLRFFLYFDN